MIHQIRSFLHWKLKIASDRTLPLLVITGCLSVMGTLFQNRQPEKMPIACKHMAQKNGVIRCDGQGEWPGALVLLDRQKIDINQASAADLLHVLHISQKLAVAIVARRDNLGRFSEISEVDAIKGVGPKIRERILQQTRFGLLD